MAKQCTVKLIENVPNTSKMFRDVKDYF